MAAACPWLTVERNVANGGFPAGVNSILDRAAERGYDYALVCNNDIEVAPDALARLVATARAHPDAAIVGAVEVGWHSGTVRCVGGVRHGLVRSRTTWTTSVPPGPSVMAFVQGALFLVEVAAVRAGPAYTPKPIVFNEDDHFDFDRPENNFLAALREG